MTLFRFTHRFLLAALLFAAPIAAFCQVSDKNDTAHTSRANLHFQATYIYQYQPDFYAKYSGHNSLKKFSDQENSITSTLYFGLRLWRGAEIYINPEIAGGSGLSGAFGLAASANGETFRVGDPAPTLYLARGMITQTFPLGSAANSVVPEGANELGGPKPTNYLKLIAGKISLGDIFDNNTYAASPRTQFMNWCLMSNGAWDYAANLRGYTYAFAAVLQQGNMAYKAAIATLPTVANGPDLNTDISQEYSLNAQVERTWKWHAMPGNLRLLGYYNNGDMGNYAAAMQDAAPGVTPNVISTRKYYRGKTGLGLNMDQQLTTDLGMFARLGWNDGQNETWCFTEVDEVVCAGLSLTGNQWNRKSDVVGLGVDVNGLSANHRNYLAAGGLGFQLGDGALSYANESVAEFYYSYKVSTSNLWLTGDYQFLVNPGYNSARGPVNVFSFRVHVEL